MGEPGGTDNELLSPKRAEALSLLQQETPSASRQAEKRFREMSPLEVASNDLIKGLQPAIERIVTQMMPQLVKAITTSLTEEIKKRVNAEISSVKKEAAIVKNDLLTLATRTEINHLADLDCLEQYNRRDNLIMNGLEESEDEDLQGKIKDLANTMDIKVRSSDISIAHRLPARRGQSCRPVIVRFCRRQKKVDIMRSKRKLISSQVFIEEDLTGPRRKKIMALKHTDNIEPVWTVEGNICFLYKNQQYGARKTIKDLCELAAVEGWRHHVLDMFNRRIDLPDAAN